MINFQSDQPPRLVYCESPMGVLRYWDSHHWSGLQIDFPAARSNRPETNGGGSLACYGHNEGGRDVYITYAPVNTPSSNSPELLQPISDEYRSKPTADELMEAIEALPALQRDSAGEHYVGTKFRWPAEIRVVSQQGEGWAGMMFVYGDKPVGTRIRTRVLISDYVWLKHVKGGEKVLITGEITAWDSLYFQVELHSMDLQD